MGEKESKRCVVVGRLEPFLGKVVDELVAREMRDARARRSRHGKRSTGLDGLSYRRVFHGGEVVEGRMVKKVERKAEEVLT